MVTKKIVKGKSIVKKQLKLQPLVENWIETPDSSNVSRFKYDEQQFKLTVQFKTGKAYEYVKVEKSVYQHMQRLLKNKESIGSYVSMCIVRNKALTYKVL